jgi:hypothetical protein
MSDSNPLQAFIDAQELLKALFSEKFLTFVLWIGSEIGESRFNVAVFLETLTKFFSISTMSGLVLLIIVFFIFAHPFESIRSSKKAKSWKLSDFNYGNWANYDKDTILDSVVMPFVDEAANGRPFSIVRTNLERRPQEEIIRGFLDANTVFRPPNLHPNWGIRIVSPSFSPSPAQLSSGSVHASEFARLQMEFRKNNPKGYRKWLEKQKKKREDEIDLDRKRKMKDRRKRFRFDTEDDANAGIGAGPGAGAGAGVGFGAGPGAGASLGFSSSSDISTGRGPGVGIRTGIGAGSGFAFDSGFGFNLPPSSSSASPSASPSVSGFGFGLPSPSALGSGFDLSSSSSLASPSASPSGPNLNLWGSSPSSRLSFADSWLPIMTGVTPPSFPSTGLKHGRHRKHHRGKGGHKNKIDSDDEEDLIASLLSAMGKRKQKRKDKDKDKDKSSVKSVKQVEKEKRKEKKHKKKDNSDSSDSSSSSSSDSSESSSSDGDDSDSSEGSGGCVFFDFPKFRLVPVRE